jgi:hypothetical protein
MTGDQFVSILKYDALSAEIGVEKVLAKIWEASAPQRAQLETLAVQTLEAAMESAVGKVLGEGSPLDKAVEQILRKAAADIIASIPAK